MDIQPPQASSLKQSISPSTSTTAIISPETMSSHHSSPAKKSRVHYQHHQHHHHHQVTTIDETTTQTKIPLSVSAHHQLVAAIGTPSSSGPHPSISGVSGLHLQLQEHQKSTTHTTTQTTHTGHLALLYHSSSHHHHHLHPVLPIARRPSRLPAPVHTRPPEMKA